jgi:hypothetical protein
MRRVLEGCIIFLKEDLKLAEAFKSAKDNLLHSINNKTYFSEELADYFKRDNEHLAFVIEATDPSQVALLKKLINSLENAEQILGEVERFNIARDRYSVEMAYEATRIIYKALSKVGATLDMLNQSNIDIQHIIEPHIQGLMPRLALASKTLEQFSPKYPEESAGTLLAGLVKKLPTERPDESQSREYLSQFIFELPHYFEELQKMVATGASGIAIKSITNAEEYQAAMLKKADQTKHQFDRLMGRKSTFFSMHPYLALCNTLRIHTFDLLHTAAPLTKQAYLDAAEVLKGIKHRQLPQIISKLEEMEESMGLTPGILTDPALEQMNKYYTQLAAQVENMAVAAGYLDMTSDDLNSTFRGQMVRFLFKDKKEDVGEKLEPILNLAVMQDEQFSEKRRVAQLERLSRAQLDGENTSSRKVAEEFFKRLAAYSTLNQALCQWSLANVSQDEKNELINEYKQFQSHFAKAYPKIDKLIVDALTNRADSTIVSRFYSFDFKQLWGGNHFTQILSCKERVLIDIDHHRAQSLFKEKLIKKTMSHAVERVYKDKNQQTVLSSDVAAYQPINFVVEENKSASFYHERMVTLKSHITRLVKAKDNAKDFFDFLDPLNRGSPLAELGIFTEEAKEPLRRAYQQFQPYLIAMGKEDLNERLVSSLNSESTLELPLRVVELMSMKEEFTAKLERFLTQTQEEVEDYRALGAAARFVELQNTPLVVLGDVTGGKTLFGMLHGLKLSNSASYGTKIIFPLHSMH